LDEVGEVQDLVVETDEGVLGGGGEGVQEPGGETFGIEGLTI